MDRKRVSRIAGALYVSTVLAFVLANLALKGQLIDAADIPSTLGLVAANAFQYRTAVSIDFLAMVAVMALAFSLYVVLRPINPYLALLALGWRIGEVVLQAGAKIPDYLLLTLGRSAITSSAAGMGDVEILGQILIAASTWAVWTSFVFLSIGSLFNNYLFLKGREIPVALAIYGLISAILFALGSILALVIDLPENANMVMMLPMVAFELVLGFYLMILGIRESAA
jgi:hypothetical protein